jgi:hypothetical protein
MVVPTPWHTLPAPTTPHDGSRSITASDAVLVIAAASRSHSNRLSLHPGQPSLLLTRGCCSGLYLLVAAHAWSKHIRMQAISIVTSSWQGVWFCNILCVLVQLWLGYWLTQQMVVSLGFICGLRLMHAAAGRMFSAVTYDK